MYFLNSEFGLLIHLFTPPMVLWILSVCVIAGLLISGKKSEAIIFAIALFATTIAIWSAKLFFAIPRPVDALVSLDSYAFPSGHAASGMFLAVMLSWLYIKHTGKLNAFGYIMSAVFILFGLLLGYSRILIGVHTPFQVFAGFILGSAVPLAVLFALSKGKGYLSRFGK